MGHIATADETRWGVRARVLALQAGATVLVAGVALFWGKDAAWAALVGGAVAVLPNAAFAWMLGRGGGVAAAQAARALGQWLGKVALTVGLLVVAIAHLEVGGVWFVAGLAAALLAPLGVPFTGALGRT